ncbi:MAG: hypothetical protein JWP06_149 [Candidatus Saccharibacteria bacterium]|nr:hypothetical protein [Candidatus Saccharibacteria bacterium]
MKAKLNVGPDQSGEVEITVEEVEGFIKAIVPDAILHLGGILSDNVQSWRYKNQLNIVKKAEINIKASGLPSNKIPLKVLLPIMEGSALEEDESIQDKWSNLLANAATGRIDVTPNYAAILSQLSSFEVKMLDDLYDSMMQSSASVQGPVQFFTDSIVAHYQVDKSTLTLAIENLSRLSLFRSPSSKGMQFGDYPLVMQTTDIFEFTVTGKHFVEVCRWVTLEMK